MNLAIFCTQLTFDLILRLVVICRLGIHPSVFSYILRNTFSMDAKMYSKMPTEFFFWLFGLPTIKQLLKFTIEDVFIQYHTFPLALLCAT